MTIKVNPHYLEIKKDIINEKEINVTKCSFEFSEEITDEYVKEAYFTKDNTSYKVIIVNNECDIPSEVLTEKGQIELGVVCYLVENEEEIKRYNPSPVYFDTLKGSIKANAENTEPITPSEMEQYEQALNNGLNELDTALDDLQDKVDSGYFKGEKGDRGDTGPQGIQGERGLQGEQGIQGVKGDKGEKGDKGDTGEKGQDGTNGIDGQDGADGRDGVIQYTAGENITIENNVISAIGGGSTTYLGKMSDYSTQQTAINLDDLDVGIYTLIADSRYLYLKATYNNVVIEGNKNTGTDDYANHIMFLTIEQKAEDVTTSNNRLGYLSFLEMNTSNVFILQHNYIIRFNTDNINMSTDSKYLFYLLTKGDNQTISGKKTFSTLPESSIAPTSDNQLANKKYVDDTVAGAGGGLEQITTETNIWELEEGIYDVAPSVNLVYNSKYFYITTGPHGMTLFVEKASNGKVPFYAMGKGIVSGYTNDNNMIIGSAQNTVYGTYDLYNVNKLNTAIATSGDYYIYGTFSFSNHLPESSIVPTTDDQLVNKKYVDDAIAQAISNL